jgi:hypothetical protein
MSTQDRNEESLWEWARKRVKLGHRLRLRVAAFVLGMLVLTPVWAVAEYLSAGGWPQRLSPNHNPGDWSPWIIWVALAWGFYVALSAVALHFHRSVSDRESTSREHETVPEQTTSSPRSPRRGRRSQPRSSRASRRRRVGSPASNCAHC